MWIRYSTRSSRARSSSGSGVGEKRPSAQPVDAAVQRRRLLRREQVRAVDADRRRAQEALRAASASSTISRTSIGDAARPGSRAGRQRRRVRRAALPEQELYFHLIEQPTGVRLRLRDRAAGEHVVQRRAQPRRVQRRVAVVGVRRAAVDDAARRRSRTRPAWSCAPHARATSCDSSKQVRRRRTRPRRRAPSSPPSESLRVLGRVVGVDLQDAHAAVGVVARDVLRCARARPARTGSGCR